MSNSEWYTKQHLNDVGCGFEFPEPIELQTTLLDYVDLTNQENLYGRQPLNKHQEWKQEMYKMYIDTSDGIIKCKRLQTVPEWYEFPVSDTQAYKMLGNGWSVDVIVHLIEVTFI